MFKCSLCNSEFDNQSKFSKHTFFHHNLRFPEYVVKIKYNSIHPLCGCGCGEPTKYNPGKGDFYNFISGHHSRLEGHWGDWNNPERVNKIKTTRKEKFASGEYNHIKEEISKSRLGNKELGKKISEANKGIPKPKPEGFGVGRIQSESTRQKMSNKAKNRTRNLKQTKKSLLELKFQSLLEEQKIKFKYLFYLKTQNSHFIYDFFIPKHNIIIEIDGDFWHSNPKYYPNGPVYQSQIKNYNNDILKNQWAEENGYKLLRFWEDDINNNLDWVKETLKKELK